MADKTIPGASKTQTEGLNLLRDVKESMDALTTALAAAGDIGGPLADLKTALEAVQTALEAGGQVGDAIAAVQAALEAGGQVGDAVAAIQAAVEAGGQVGDAIVAIQTTMETGGDFAKLFETGGDLCKLFEVGGAIELAIQAVAAATAGGTVASLVPQAAGVGPAIPFMSTHSWAAPGGAATDVQLFAGNFPVKASLLAAVFYPTAGGANTVTLRTAAAGAGDALSAALDTNNPSMAGELGAVRVGTGNTVAANGSVFANISADTIAGELVCWWVPRT